MDNPLLKRRRILHDLVIDKIAAVDRPAQEHARATIMKRADDGKPKRRIMREFVIKELSCVDHPAVAGARMTLMKRADEQETTMHVQKIEGREVASFNSFEEACSHLVKIAGSRAGAMSVAAREHPDLLEKYQRAGDEKIAKAAEDAVAKRSGAATAAAQRFALAVGAVMQRDGVSRSAAMSRARAENPDLYAAYQAA